MPVLLQYGFHFTLVQRSAQFALPVFDLCAQVLREFADDVVSLRRWQATSDGFEIVIDKFHGGLLPAEELICNQADVTNLKDNLNGDETRLRDRA
jgi:hypothetical protein